MIVYLWIGLGGAIGSIGRAWLAVTVARITGPQFPWGTILINILGSFVIGFFGTLTASDSRYSVPTDARAFVMVGICGGFTTFSSFSLQTLELARDGRVAQALGNVGLSVVLCLLAVAAGHYGAAAMPRTQMAAASAGGDGMGEVVVAVLNRPREAETLLDAATRLLEIGGGGRLMALAVRLPPAATILPSEEVLTASREESIQSEQENWAGQLRSVVDDWASRARQHRVQTDLVNVEGDAASIVTDYARRADAIVVARPGAHDTERMRDCMHAALFDTESPVLVVPPGFQGPLGQVVAIAWKNDERAVKAVRASLPVLRHARQIHVLCAGDSAEMPAILKDHGITAELHVVVDGKGSTGTRLLAAAHEVGADLLVLGAFAHGRWREMVFGGVTRTMLAEADVPLLIRH
jgi:protein CrcB